MTASKRFSCHFSLRSSVGAVRRCCVLAAVLLGLGLMGLAPSAAHAQANTFTVNSTADTDPPDDMVGDGVCDTGETTGDGEPECTLRAALEEAQNNTAVDTVRFDDIPTGGIIGGDFAIISVTAENDELLLGGIDDGVFIDGTTAPGYPSDLGGPIVGIDATDLPDDVDQGLDLDSDTDAKIRVEGISVFGAADDVIDDRGNAPTEIIDCWIGIEPDGTVTPNGRNPGSFELGGLSLRRDNTVARGNVIAGPNCANADDDTVCGAILSEGQNQTIKGNIIGVGPNGEPFDNPISDNGRGIVAGEGNVVIGYDYDESIPDNPSPLEGGEGNLITENTDDGITVGFARGDSVGMGIRGNRIYGNDGSGINIDASLTTGGFDGVSESYNGNDEGDTDEGLNRSQNHPVIKSTECTADGSEVTADVTYRVRSNADSTTASNYGENGLAVDFYVTEEGETQGKTYLGTDRYAAVDAGGAVTVTLTTSEAACSDNFVATATDADNNTSQFNSSSALPVELASFDGTQTGEQSVRLAWTTSSEQNNAGFRVQRATESGWTILSFVEGEGTTTEAQTYRFDVEDLEPGTHRFRLTQVDLDGSTTVHDPITVDLRMQEALRLSAPSPNPVQGSANFNFAVRDQQSTTVSVYNVLGQRVATLFEGTPAPGESTSVQLGADRVSSLSSGTYFLRLQAGEHTTTERFTVVR